MVKIGFVFGGRHGRGIATCRTTSGWSAPAPFSVTGGSWGLQIGGEAIDVVMLVMNDNGMEKMLSSKFKIGADASAAAGPVGRHVEGKPIGRCAPKSSRILVLVALLPALL